MPPIVMRISVALFVVGGLVVLSVRSTVAFADEEVAFRVRPGQRQLFVDDHGIAKMMNLTWTMHSPVKKGAVIEPDQPWESLLQVRCAPVWDELRQQYKIWLISAAPGFSMTGVGYAESRDGLKWTKPILNQVDRRGSNKNNLLALESLLENVVYDPHEPDPTRRFKGLLGTNGRQPLASGDGITWKKLPVPLLPSQDESNLSYDRHRRQFIATLKQSGPNGRSVTLTTSNDFETWTKPELVFHTDDEDQRLAIENIQARLADPKLRNPLFNDPADYNADVYNMGVFAYEGVYIGLPAIYHAVGRRPQGNTDGFHLIQLAMSRDLKHWRRLGDRQPFIGPSAVDSRAYDTTQLLPPSSPVVHGDELRFYYTGLKYRHVPEDADPKGGAICLAVLRRDGFMSLDAGDQPGSVLTQPFTFLGGALHVNVDAGGRSLSAELIAVGGADDGQMLARSKSVAGDQHAARIEWADAGLDKLQSRTVRLKFTCRQAQFYSYWFAGNKPPLPPFYSDKMRLLHWLDDAGESHVINKPAEWRHRRVHVLQNMSRVMGPLPERDGTPLDVQVVSSERLETLTRKKVTYLSSQGDRVPAYLLIPHDIQRPRPAMLCLHGTSGPKGRTAGLGKPYPRYTLELAQRGYVTIAPDYTLLGENQTDPAAVGYVSGTMKGIWNHMRAVDLLASLPEVDAQRIGCCGVSLGGHNSLFVGVFDPRLKVVVTSSGFDSFLDYMDGDPTGWCQTRYMPRIETVFDKDPKKLTFDFPEVLAAIAPRHLYVHAPLSDSNFKVESARRCVDAAKQVYGLLDVEPNLVAVYPEGKHGFPPDQREAAYQFIDEVLQWDPPEN